MLTASAQYLSNIYFYVGYEVSRISLLKLFVMISEANQPAKPELFVLGTGLSLQKKQCFSDTNKWNSCPIMALN